MYIYCSISNHLGLEDLTTSALARECQRRESVENALCSFTIQVPSQENSSVSLNVCALNNIGLNEITPAMNRIAVEFSKKGSVTERDRVQNSGQDMHVQSRYSIMDSTKKAKIMLIPQKMTRK